MASKNDPYVHFVTNNTTTNTLGTSFTVPVGTVSDELLYTYMQKLHDIKDKLDITPPSSYLNNSIIIKKPDPLMIDTYDDVEEI